MVERNVELRLHRENPKLGAMAKLTSEKADREVVATNSAFGTHSKARICSSSVKYYIHDSTEACRLQLLGELSDSDVGELSGCWRTAKTTLGNRRLILDLRGLKTVGDAGRQWLVEMAKEGAIYLPDSYLRDGLSAPVSSKKDASPGLFNRLFSVLRGSRAIPAQSSTQAQ